MVVDSIPKILIVDDDPWVLKSLEGILGADHYAISTAETGVQAIDLLSREKFDLCLVDLILPEVTGKDVMAYINACQSNTDIIVVSGDTHIDAAISALSHGASAFIKKPFSSDELSDTVSKVLKKKSIIRQKLDLHEKIRRSEKLHRFLSRNCPDFIYLLNPAGEFIYVNDRVESLLGYRRAELLGRHYTAVVFEDDLSLARHRFDERRTGDRATRNLHLRLKRKNAVEGATPERAHIVHVELNSLGIYSNHDIGTHSQPGSLGVVREVNALGQFTTGFEFAAYHDSLTGLPNRLLLHDRLTVALDHARRRGYLLVVMFIDLDGFKEVNDSMGHASGDKVLKVIASRLKLELRKADTLARFGGDEFILMLPQIDSLVQAETIAKKVLATIHKPIIVNNQNVAVSASIGIAVFPGDGDTEESLIRSADAAMYGVKNRQKSDFQFFSRPKSLPSKQRPVRNHELVDAIESNQFIMFYQPLFDRGCERIVGIEALFRWHHPKKGLIFPSEILAEARQAEVTPIIDTWVFNKTRTDFFELLGDGISGITLFLNVSMETFSGPDFCDWIANVVSTHRSFAENLCIEIPAEALLKPDPALSQKFDRIRDLGIKAVIDLDKDYELAALPPPECGIYGLKIDTTGSTGFPHSRPGSYYPGLIGAFRRKGMVLIAKKVEFRLDPSMYGPIEFNMVQGFLYYHPLPLKTVKSVIKDTRSL